jgi:hypothetical protein
MTGMQLTPIFCLVDDFCQNILSEFRKKLIGDGKKLRVRKSLLSGSAPYGLNRSAISVSGFMQFILMKSLKVLGSLE